MPPPASHPRSVFVSYAREDLWFVDLMVELLDFHRIRPWHDLRDVRPAAGVSDAVRQGLRETEAMIVVLSPHAVASNWVSQEYFAFATLHGMQRIHPVKLRDYADTAGVFRELQALQTIDFEASMLSGFRELTDAFGKSFLRPLELRQGPPDRRRSQPAQRLQHDFLSALARFPDIHRHEPMSREEQGQLFVEVVESFHDVLYQRYTVTDRRNGQRAPMAPALFEELILTMDADFDALERLVPDFFVSAVVRRLTQLFRIEPIDRRQRDPVPQRLAA